MIRAVPIPFCGAVLFAASAAAAPALPPTAFQRAEVFATCAGRLSALATFQRATQTGSHSATETLRDNFDMLLEATLPAAMDQGVPVGEETKWQARGWAEVAGLLSAQQDRGNPTRVDHANDGLNRVIEDCRALILTSG